MFKTKTPKKKYKIKVELFQTKKQNKHTKKVY